MYRTPAEALAALTETARIVRALPADCSVDAVHLELREAPRIHATHSDPLWVHRSLGAATAHVQPSGCAVAEYAGIVLYVSPARGQTNEVRL